MKIVVSKNINVEVVFEEKQACLNFFEKVKSSELPYILYKKQMDMDTEKQNHKNLFGASFTFNLTGEKYILEINQCDISEDSETVSLLQNELFLNEANGFSYGYLKILHNGNKHFSNVEIELSAPVNLNLPTHNLR